MEEILASIRRIISEEGEPAKADASAPAPAPQETAAEDDILDLTEMVEDDDNLTLEGMDLEMTEDDPSAAPEDIGGIQPDMDAPHTDAIDPPLQDSAPEPAPAPAPQPQSSSQPSPRQAPPAATLMDDVPAFTDMVDPAEEDDAIMAEDSSHAVRDAFGQLSDLLVAGYAGSDKTLEGMVREMLKPMLKAWLDKNLPPIVERAVAREIARLARVKRP